jgi:hypothetical protein
MRVFVTSKLVYRAIRNAVGPWLKTEGFRRTRSTSAAWYRPSGETMQLTVGFSVDFYGGADWGNGISGAVGEHRLSGQTLPRGTIRSSDFCRCLLRSELDAWQRIQSRINMRRPMSDFMASTPVMTSSGRSIFLPVTTPFEEGGYFSFDYYAMDDVEEICAFLAWTTPAVLARFLAHQTPLRGSWLSPQVDGRKEA